MFLYLRLVLAHFIADYPLQTNRIYYCKIRSLKGQLLHAGIHALVYTVFLIPFWHHPLIWVFILLAGTLHLGIDILKVHLIDRTRIPPLFTYTMDQVLHLCSLTLVFLFPFSKEIPPMPNSALWQWYWNDRVIVFLACFLFATYFTTYFLECWRVTRQSAGLHVDGYTLTPAIKYLGIWERGLIMILTATPNLFFAAPFVLLLRVPFLAWLRSRGKDTAWLLNYREMIAGAILSVAAGLIVLNFAAFQN